MSAEQNLALVKAAYEASFTTVPEYFLADDERVVALTHTTTDGQPSDAADVSTIRNGKLVKFQTAMDTALLERVFGTT